MSPKARKLFALRYMGLIASEEAADWAMSELETGNVSDSLSILAGLTPPVHWQELERYLHQALAELHWSIPPQAECLRAYIHDVAREILSGAVPPLEGCRAIYKVTQALDYPADLTVWLDLDDEIEPGTYRGLAGTALEQAIVREAADLVAGSATSAECSGT